MPPVTVSTVDHDDDESSSGVMVEDVVDDSSSEGDASSFPDENSEEEPFQDEVVISNIHREENVTNTLGGDTVMSIPSAGASTNRAVVSTSQFDPLQNHVNVGGSGMFPSPEEAAVATAAPIMTPHASQDDPFAVIENDDDDDDDTTSNMQSEDGTTDDDDDENFHDELPNEGNKKKKKKAKKAKKEKKAKAKKAAKSKKKKDAKVNAITYLDGDGDDITAASGAETVDFGMTDDEDRFEDEHQVNKKDMTTSTKAPAKNQDHDLEAALGAASSLAMTHTIDNTSGQHQEDIRFVIGNDELEEYNANNDSMDSDGVFLPKKNSSNQSSSMSLKQSLRNMFSPTLVGNERAMPSQEAWQDEDGFHDELVVFNDGKNGNANPQDNTSLSSEEQESLFTKTLSMRNGKARASGLFFDRQSKKCWCYAILALAVFLALLIPLCMLARDNKEYQEALFQQQQQQEQILAGIATPAPEGTAAPTEPGACQDKIVLNHDKTCFDTQTPISFSFTHCAPNQQDWIGLYPANAVYYGRLWRDYINWIWTCGALPCTEEQVTEDLPLTGTFEAPSMDEGEYQLYLVLDSRWPYRFITGSDVFTVSDSCVDLTTGI